MRLWLLLFALLSLSIPLLAQKDKPKIERQRPVSTEEDHPVTIQLTDLVVRDRDDWFYPFGFTLTVHPGENYSVSNNTVTPALNFTGKLKVKVTVNDGEHDSNPYEMEVDVRPVNDAPVITAQVPLTTNQNQPITLKNADVTIRDPDDDKFTLTASGGANYTVSGLTITPAQNFTGQLTVPLVASDGKANSPIFNTTIAVLAVNDIPRITGQTSVSTDKGKAVTIELAHLTVVDLNNPYPAGFSLHISPPATSTYSVSGNTVQPAPNFEGVLSIPLRVNDGTDFSAIYNFQLTVRAGNSAPVIIGQSPVSIAEDEVFVMQFTHLQVSDSDNTYPNGFGLKISPGPNYTVSGNQITPAQNFTGRLVVPVLVNDGKNDSAPFNFQITVGSSNDSPVVALEADPLIFQPGRGPVSLTEQIQITDAENDSITQAEISFFPQFYTPGYDELRYQGSDIIKVSFDVQRGVLLMTGRAVIADYLSAIKAIQYNYLAGPDTFKEGKKFSIKVSDRFSTSAAATREIRTKALDIALDIPSGFTPNGDSSNDTWVIKILKVSEELNSAVVRVYNRHGQVMFESVGFDKAWDGKLNGEVLPSDSYFYTIDLGKNYFKTPIRGVVTLLR
ncbi:MAG TPA: tandem-95 repeat protein [Chryseosolibacter sp.]